MERIAVIAGAGEFPLLVARELVRRGVEPVVVALQEEADPAIASEATTVYWQPVGKVGRLLKVLRKEGVDRAILAGKVHKTRIFRDLKPDLTAVRLLWGLRDRKDDTILTKVADILASEGITLLPQTTHMEAYLPGAQVFTRRLPTDEERADVAFGFSIAREMGRLDIGQTVVVKRGAVLAVEAIEGTDQTIRRGGSLGNGGAVVVKVAKPGQDLRFDVPAIGLETVVSCLDAGALVLAIEAEKTFFFQRAEAVSLADRNGVAILAV
ncbi:MAG: UDP-2,3-diacylglucosamine diphosphatase LpxI [Deltaproteobacteria bacterium]|nr:UDP-2,3-diacylglucosamine diphosphatase LpxI [Deltaproteobacteria bacterium]